MRAKYGKVKQAVFSAVEMNLTVLEASETFSVSKRSVRSVANHLGLKLKRIRPERKPRR